MLLVSMGACRVMPSISIKTVGSLCLKVMLNSSPGYLLRMVNLCQYPSPDITTWSTLSAIVFAVVLPARYVRRSAHSVYFW